MNYLLHHKMQQPVMGNRELEKLGGGVLPGGLKPLPPAGRVVTILEFASCAAK